MDSGYTVCVIVDKYTERDSDVLCIRYVVSFLLPQPNEFPYVALKGDCVCACIML